ncbi:MULTISPECIES: hypothetical protein [Sphingobacterium]|uniref:hypothetical protein n=1 Tax=Sphingobacterium TaxID=28453 RepID=UPI00257B040D|nr:MULTISPECIES: hypothetical protein [Sphingobacterium]
MNKVIDIGQYIAIAVNWLTDNLKPFFDLIKNTGNTSILGLEWLLIATPFFRYDRTFYRIGLVEIR